MTIPLNSRVSAEISWNRFDRNDHSSVTETGTLKQQDLFSSESTPAVDCVWTAINATSIALSTMTYTLTSLSREVLGNTETIALAKLCSLYFYNRSTTGSLVLENTAITRCVIPPGGFFCLCNPASDWTINTDNEHLSIVNSTGSAISFDLVITGIAEE